MSGSDNEVPYEVEVNEQNLKTLDVLYEDILETQDDETRLNLAKALVAHIYG
jgi:hypothetical protein